MDRDVVDLEDKSPSNEANSMVVEEKDISPDFSDLLLNLILGEDADFEPKDSSNCNTNVIQCSPDHQDRPWFEKEVVEGQLADVGDETGDWVCLSPGCRWSNYSLRKRCLKCEGPRMSMIIQSTTSPILASCMSKSPDDASAEANSKHGNNFTNNNLDQFRFEEGFSPQTGDFISKSFTKGSSNTKYQIFEAIRSELSQLTPIKSELTSTNCQLTSIKPKQWSPVSVQDSITPRRLSFTTTDNSKDPCLPKPCSDTTSRTRTKRLVV